MNEQILANREVHTDVMDLDQALADRRHGAVRRKVRRPGARRLRSTTFSKELCGGTHVAPHRRYRDLQDRLRRLHLRGRAPHRSHHRRRRPASDSRKLCSNRPKYAGVDLEKLHGARKGARARAPAAQDQSRAEPGRRSRIAGSRHQGRKSSRRASRRLRSRAAPHPGRLAAQQMEDRRGRARVGRGFERLDRHRRHQGSDGESPRRQARGRRRAGRRRQRRRASGHGRSRRQGSIRAAEGARPTSIPASKGCCRRGIVRRRHRRRGADRPRLRHRTQAARRARRADRQRLRRQFASTTTRPTWCSSPRPSCSKSAIFP